MNTLIQNIHIEIGLKQEQKIFQDNQVFADPDTIANLNPNQVHDIKDTVLWTPTTRKGKNVMTTNNTFDDNKDENEMNCKLQVMVNVEGNKIIEE